MKNFLKKILKKFLKTFEKKCWKKSWRKTVEKLFEKNFEEKCWKKKNFWRKNDSTYIQHWWMFLRFYDKKNWQSSPESRKKTFSQNDHSYFNCEPKWFFVSKIPLPFTIWQQFLIRCKWICMDKPTLSPGRMRNDDRVSHLSFGYSGGRNFTPTVT